jgi:DNA-binding XRE family transcriptional regulator
MIRNETEYQEALARISAEKERIEEQRKELKKAGLDDEKIKRVVDPILSFHLQLVEEVESYERLMRGEEQEIENLKGLGRLLVGLRIASGMTQKELAKRVGVKESQVSRDERNEYHGVSVERASRILEALGAMLKSHVNATFNASDSPHVGRG